MPRQNTAALITDDAVMAYSLGDVIKLIIGSSNRKEEARLLSLAHTTFARLLNSTSVDDVPISQDSIAKNGWRKILAARHPKNWAKYADLFEEAVAVLPAKKGPKTREPKDKNTAGYTLWLIFGGHHYTGNPSRILQVHLSFLSRIIHNKCPIPVKRIMKDGWYDLLEEHFPKTWPLYGELLKQQIEGQIPTTPPDVSPRIPAEKPPSKLSFKQQAAALAKRLMKNRGDEPTDIAPGASYPALRSPETWQRILEVDESLTDGIYANSLRDLSVQYGLPTAPESRDYRDVTNLLARAKVA